MRWGPQVTGPQSPPLWGPVGGLEISIRPVFDESHCHLLWNHTAKAFMPFNMVVKHKQFSAKYSPVPVEMSFIKAYKERNRNHEVMVHSSSCVSCKGLSYCILAF